MEGARGILSCASCRQRKLRCDRKEPCSNCTARSCTCVYASQSRGRSSAQRRDANHQLNSRIRHLEQLIDAITTRDPAQTRSSSAQGDRQPDADALGSVDPKAGDHSLQQANSNGSPPTESLEIKPGRILSTNKQTTYVSDTHWAAICNDVADIRNSFDQSNLEDDEDALESAQNVGPMLLEGVRPTSDMRDILCDVPPRDVVDRLVSRYFNSPGHSIGVLHAPSFGQEYNRFWLDPQQASVPWISLLFGIMASGTFLYMRSQDVLPGDLGNPSEVMEVFQRRSTECLIISKYFTEPCHYTIEALMMNLQNEFIRRRDAHLGVWLLAGVCIRLAMRMGYHRDPGDYPQFSAFQGEMRRRVWACILPLDALTSFQLGLPPMIQESLCDTRLPLNLLDEDFGPGSIELPPERPETDLTPVSYIITKAALMSVFRTIFTQVSLGRTEAYEDIMALDHRLRSAHESITPPFRMVSLEESVTAPPYMLIRRYTLELLFQKARCMLHRHHMAKSYQDPKYDFSRRSCVEAAMAILTHQNNMLKELHVGGLLYRIKSLVSSLEQSDFLLASMIICLEVSSRAREEATLGHNCVVQGLSRFTQQDLIEALHNSHRHLDELKTSSADCQKAFTVLSAMLQRFSENTASHESQQFSPVRNIVSTNITDTIPHIEQGDVNTGFGHSNNLNLVTDPTRLPQLAFSPTALDTIGSFFTSPDVVNWDLWDTFIQSSSTSEDFRST